MQDGSIHLRWQSETGAVYSLESTETLSPEPDGAIPFILRDDRIVSQGTNTTWLDYGDPAYSPRIYHPFDAPQRFYRVCKVEQSTNAPLSISILQPTTTTVNGDVTVEVSVNTTNPVGLIRLFVDGQPVDLEFGVDTLEFSINTTEWINGSHVLHVTAELVGESGTTGLPGDPQPAQPAVGASAPLTLEFDNLIHDFTVLNPYFDPYDPVFPEIQVVYAALTEPCDWTVEIVDENENVVMDFSDSGSFIYIEWDGTDSLGTPLPPGFYDYILTATKQSAAQLTGSSTSGTSQQLVSQTTLSSSPQLIKDPVQRAERINEINKSRKFGLADEMRSALGWPDVAHPSLEKARPSGPRIPWFMRPKAVPADGAPTQFELPIPPLPPLTRTKYNTHNWDFMLSEYLLWSNNIVQSFQESFLQSAALREQRRAELMASSTLETAEPLAGFVSQFSQASQTTRNPRRQTGRTQMSWFGSVGAMSQGHHPSTNQAPWSYGPLNKANTVAKLFIQQMEKGSTATKFPAWKKTFLLTDNQVRKTNVVGTGYLGGAIITSNSWFNRYANLAMLVGHTLEYNPPGWPAGTFGPLASYPLYNSSNTNGYTWIPDAEMRFGSPYLKWMAYYGCNVLTRSRWFGGAKDHFTWPINPSLNVYLAAGSTIYMYDEVGRLWAKGMQGELNGVPMTLVNAWIQAGIRAHVEVAKTLQIGGIRMSYLYWDARQEGGAYTLTDKFKPFEANFSLVGRSVENLQFDDPVVYSPPP